MDANDEALQQAVIASMVEAEQEALRRSRQTAELEEAVRAETRAALARERAQQSLNRRRWTCAACSLENCSSNAGVACSACGYTETYCPLPAWRLGVEFEMVLVRASGYTHEDVAQVLDQGLGVPTKFLGYTHDALPTHWKVVPDRSVSGEEDSDLPFELVSPIVRGEQGVLAVRHVLQEVVDKLGVSVNSTTDPSRRGVNNHYAKSNRLALGGTLSNKQVHERVRRCTTVESLVDTVCPHKERHYKLNMRPLLDRRSSPTIEFRSHHGTLSPDEAEAWTRLVLRFVVNSATLPEPRHVNEGFSSAELFLQLFDSGGGLVGDPALLNFFLARVKGGVDSWTCHTCGKTFAEPKRLGQHQRDSGH